MTKLQLEVHTHTIASGHAYGTIDEMARDAKEKGLKLLGITEHTSGVPGTCSDIYFGNLVVLPRNMYGVEMLFGAEINIIDYEGHLDLNERLIQGLDFRIAGIHGFCYKGGTMEENTNAIIGAIKNPYIDLISHPDDGKIPLDYEKVVLAAKEYHTLLEINNNSLRVPHRLNVKENSLKLLELCKQYQVPIIISSDAHHMYDLANLDHVLPVLEEAHFPDELVLNYDLEKFKAFIQENRNREKNV